MSDESVVETEGVTVTKSFDAEGFPVPAVTFRVESDRSDPVGLRITDEIPDGFGIEQIGFHPDYGSEHWTATGEGVVRFERTVNPGEAFTTVYGIRMADDDEPTPFLESPGVEVDPDAIEEEEIDEVVPKESSEVVRELASGKRDTVPGLEEDESGEVEAEPVEADSGVEALAEDDAEIIGEPEEEPAATEADEPLAEEAGDEPLTAESDEAAIIGESTDDAPEESEQTVAEFAGADEEPDSEMEADEPLGADAIEERMKAGDEEAGAEDVEDMEAEVAEDAADELEADVDATEAGAVTDAEPAEIAEEATEPAVEEPESESDLEEAMTPDIETESIAAALAAEIEAGNVDDENLDVIRSAVTEEGQDQSDVVRIDHLQSRVSDLEAYTDALESFIDENGTAQELLDDMESTVSAFQSDLDEIEGRLDSAASERDSLDDRLANVNDQVGDVEDLDDQLERLRGDLDALDERVDDAESVRFEMEELEDDMADLRDQVEEVKEWRDQLSNVFGGA